MRSHDGFQREQARRWVQRQAQRARPKGVIQDDGPAVRPMGAADGQDRGNALFIDVSDTSLLGIDDLTLREMLV
jgi:hypothetical protein